MTKANNSKTENKKSRPWIIISGILLSVLVTFIAINVVLGFSLSKKLDTGRLPKEDYRPSDIPGILFTLAPENSPGGEIGINSDGFRSRNFDPGFDGLKVMIVGDSISFGSHLDRYEDTLAGNLEKEFAAGGQKSVVYNLGIPAWSVSQKIAAFKAYEKKLNPDVLLFQTEPGDFPFLKPLVLTPLERAIPLLAWMKYRIYRTGEHEIQPEDAYKDFKSLVRQCNEDNIRLIVVMYPFLEDDSTRTEHGVDIKRYRDAGTAIINLIGFFNREVQDIKSLRAAAHDSLHPNARANRIAAKVIATEIVPE